MKNVNHKVDFYFEKPGTWQNEIQKLRSVILDCGLLEELKWGTPCYTNNKHNIVLIHVFKEYCALLFFKGALMKDESGILIQQTKNVQAARQVRFTNMKEIAKWTPTIKKYIFEAIEIEKAGLKVEFKKTASFEMAGEFKKKLDKNASLKKAFHALTPGRQRAYLLFFSSAKLQKTREARIEKAIPQIMKGKGMDD